MSNFDLKTFIKESSAQSLGKFGEFLFAKFCASKNISYSSKHKGGVDFSFDNENRNNSFMSPEEIKKTFVKTGTTICGVVCKDGVIIAADTRAT